MDQYERFYEAIFAWIIASGFLSIMFIVFIIIQLIIKRQNDKIHNDIIQTHEIFKKLLKIKEDETADNGDTELD